ncbi:MAG TPA: DUF4397 domain-containing protein [Cyclobacteriaceae bacterium]
MKNALLRLMNFQNWTIILLMAVLTACIDKTEAPEPTIPGYVNLYNAAADGTSLDIYFNNTDTKVNQNPFDYSKYSGYLNFPVGSNTVKFNEYNTTTKVAEKTFNVVELKAYSLFVIYEDAQLGTLLLEDVSPEVTTGNARVRLVQISPDSPALDIAITDDKTYFSNTAFKSASSYIEIPANGTEKDFKIIKSGTDSVISTVKLKLDETKYYTLVAKGFFHPPTGNNNKVTLQLIPN